MVLSPMVLVQIGNFGQKLVAVESSKTSKIGLFTQLSMTEMSLYSPTLATSSKPFEIDCSIMEHSRFIQTNLMYSGIIFGWFINMMKNGLEIWKICPKIAPDHVNPHSLLKMRIYLALQILSKSMANGLREYRKYFDDLKDSEETASFCERIDRLFDALNRFEIRLTPNAENWKIILDSIE